VKALLRNGGHKTDYYRPVRLIPPDGFEYHNAISVVFVTCVAGMTLHALGQPQTSGAGAALRRELSGSPAEGQLHMAILMAVV
jgi:hypothetical protein